MASSNLPPNATILLEAACGYCVMEGKRVVPQRGKGSLYFFKTHADGQSSVQYAWWRLAASEDNSQISTVAGTLYLDNADFRPVGNPKSRVFLLKDKVSNQKHFFWMQEGEMEGDAAIAEKAKKFLEMGAFMDEEEGEEGAPYSPTPIIPSSVTAGNSSIPQHSASGATPSASQLTMQQILQSTLSQMGVEQESDDISLVKMIENAEGLEEVLSDSEVREALLSLLPEGLQTVGELYHTVQSPQFLQSLSSIQSLLRSGQLPALLAATGLPPPTASVGGVRMFLSSIQKDADNNKPNTQ